MKNTKNKATEVKYISKDNSKYIYKLLFIDGSKEDNELRKTIIEDFSPYNCKYKNFSFSNYYSTIQNINETILEDDINIVIGEGIGGFHTMMISNEKLPDDYCSLVFRIIINPCIKPSEDLLMLGYSEAEAETYITNEQFISRQKYIDTRHSLCIISKDNPIAIKYANDFKKKYNIHCIVVDTINKEFVANELKHYVDELIKGKEF